MQALASDARELEHTWGGLERWARDIHDALGGPLQTQ